MLAISALPLQRLREMGRREEALQFESKAAAIDEEEEASLMLSIITRPLVHDNSEYSMTALMTQ